MLIVLMWWRRQFVFIEDKEEERNKKEVMHRALCELLFYFKNIWFAFSWFYDNI